MEGINGAVLVLLSASILLSFPFGSLSDQIGTEELVRISKDVQFSRFNESFIQLPRTKGHTKIQDQSASNRRSLNTCPRVNKLFSTNYLKYHNVYRNALYKRPLKWENCLARRAQAWATKMAKKACPLPPVNNKFGSTVTYSSGNLGENLFFAWYFKGYDKWNSTTILNYWGTQRLYYNYNTNRCGKKKFCGNYLQIIWKPANYVGCGIAVCDLKFAPNWEFKVVVCNYDKQFFYDTKPY